jgi:ribosomal protein S27AE
VDPPAAALSGAHATTHAGDAFERRRPEESVLYRAVQRELPAFLRCGILAHGFVRVHCDECGLDRVVAFSCKGRGFCPSCGGRRMADTAAHLVDRVLLAAPVRQWVLTLPYSLRYRCAYDVRLTSEVLRAFIRALFAELRGRVRRQWGVRAEQCGAVTFVQRFGSALDLNVHFHTLALDGAYTHAVGPGQPTRFLPLPPPDAGEVARVLAGAARRIERLVEARAGDDADALARDEPLLALLSAASLRTRAATGPHRGEPWRRLGDRVEPSDGDANEIDAEASARVPRHGGMSLHADVCVPARDRRRLERLCRYVARPPLANEQLEERPDGTLALRLKTRCRDGTTHIVMARDELIDRLVPLIPPPRAHQVRYHGILAPSASQRDRVVPDEPADGVDGELSQIIPERLSPTGRDTDRRAVLSQQGSERSKGTGSARPGLVARAPDREERPRQIGSVQSARRTRWAALLLRVFEVDALRCPRCGSRMRLIAAIEDPAVAERILECLKLPSRAPPRV